MHKIWIAAATVGLTACGSAPEEKTAALTPAANASVPEAAPPAVVLEGSGLRLSGAASQRSLGFGTPAAETVDLLAKALASPPTERGTNPECGGGAMDYADWKGEVRIWLLDGAFAGWDSRGELRTLEGIGIGSPRSEIAKLPGFEVEESSLGTEFRARGLSGLLDSAAPGARVSHLWGGATCVFR